ncbi:hypothetical protein HBI73_126390 [Parastagonospora nodorum]|nr:hypothetical protein HBH82_013650 [Parastagonospora nodorum]KAH4713212.1 hypothetical protein HBH67_001640 [Parastagonospora nodorum]KAH4728773.1 hypothetical protein HBH78_021420 [Parastagonospora nodorum]KAH4792133.1 hypothetical protein HBH62_016840 [Parastagonospora nodorum]KAH4830943.1 hypothetical protein HBH63_035350 [Parastagonospora nodorum]
MATTLDTRRIRRCTPAQLRDYFKGIQHDVAEKLCTLQILDAISRGSVAPSPIFSTWLGVTKSPSAIQSGLQQTFSILVREISITHLGKAFCSSRWKDLSNQLGGVPGLLNLLNNLSVAEVRNTCKALSRCARGEDITDKRRFMTELFMGLQPHVFPDVPVKSTDGRPLGRHYQRLIPSCTEELVERIVSGDLKGRWKPVRHKHLVQYHPEIIRREQLRALNDKTRPGIDQKKFQSLLTIYPQDLGTMQGFSASMNFALDLLRKLSASTEKLLSDDIFINDLVRPLLSRALKKKLEWCTVREIVDLTLLYLETHPSAGKEISISKGDVHYLVAQCWAHEPEMFEAQLKKLCSDSVFGTSSHDDIDEWNEFVDGIPRHRRYALLRLCFAESTRMDLDSDDDLKKVKGSLYDELLDTLSPEEALDLFTRLRVARGDDDLFTITAGNTITDIGPAYNTHASDPDLYHVVLLVRNGQYEQARNLATAQLELRKKKAEKASTPEQRAFYAKSSLYYGVASGDMQVYQSTLEWTKRFLRDPQVLPALYPRYGHPDEVVTLLSGIPNDLTNLTNSWLRARIYSGNATLQSLFDTACLAIREPSFQAYSWEGTLYLFQQVVSERIKKSESVRKCLSASDEEMYDILWADTLEMLLAVEKKANRRESVRLEANSICGPLGWLAHRSNGRSDFEPATPSKYIYRFFDNLAKARNEYWKTLRATVHPATLALPDPLPRGLPAQYLTNPWILNTPDLENVAPYIASRAEAVVFQDPVVALELLADDEESMEAMGMFVESYQYALRVYIPKSCSDDERTRRIQKAWNHARGPLSQGRMDDDEAVWWWREKPPFELQKYWPPYQEMVKRKGVIWPLIPDVEDPEHPCEWNPFEAGRPNRPNRDLGKLTYLDLSVLMMGKTPSIAQIWTRSMLDAYSPTVSAHKEDKSQLWASSRNIGEGGVLAALLYLEMKHGAPNGRLLQKPFPSAEDARFPSLYLDDGFQGDSLNTFNAVRHIKGHIDAIPPALMHLSAKNMMSNLWALDREEHDDHSVQELALTLLIRLSESDNPSLAQNLALQTIIGRPKASSWHRQLLKLSYLRKLSHADAKTFCERFAEAVIAKIPARKERKEDVTGEGENADNPAKSFVKVTTIKSLAQLLLQADFVDENFALSVLLTLLERASHRDVRVNTAQALLGIFETCPPELAEKILVALEGLIPIAGNLNENKLVTEEEWINAEKTLDLPGYPGIDDDLVLFELFFTHLSTTPHTSKRLLIFIERILLPTLAHRKRQVARWVALFLKKYGVEETGVLLPRVPQRASVLLGSRVACYLPRTILEDLVSYIEFNIRLPAPIVALNDRIRSDSAILKRPEVHIWFDLFGSGTGALVAFATFDILSLFDRGVELEKNVAISAPAIQEQFLKIFKAAVWADAPLHQRLNQMLLAHLLRGTYLSRPWWPTHGKSIVSHMIAYVDSIRIGPWLTDPNRNPAVLPDTFPWQLLLLDLPFPTKDSSGEESCKDFADNLSTLIDDISGTAYHENLEQIKDFLKINPPDSNKRESVKRLGKTTIYARKRNEQFDQFMRNRLVVATQLGSLHEDCSTVAQILKVEVASYLIGLARREWEDVATKELQGRVRVSVEEWKKSGCEEVRRMGFGLGWVEEK